MASQLDERRFQRPAPDPLEEELLGAVGHYAVAPAAGTTSLPLVDDTRPRQLPTGALSRAMLTWLVMVWALCWVALPLASVLLTGFSGSVLLSGIVNAPVFAVAALVAVVGAAVANPAVVLSTRSRRDPVLSAFAGGFVSWAAIHNVLPFLTPFENMATAELGILLGINLVEMSLLGMMLASFTRSRLVAFGLGAGLQWLTAGLLVMYWS